MAGKVKTVWYCTSCGNESPKWMGRCPACGEWNTMVEQPRESRKPASGFDGSADGVHDHEDHDDEQDKGDCTVRKLVNVVDACGDQHADRPDAENTDDDCDA